MSEGVTTAANPMSSKPMTVRSLITGMVVILAVVFDTYRSRIIAALRTR